MSLTAAELPSVSPRVAGEPVVRLDRVSVHYRLTLDAGVSLKEYLLRGRRRRHVEYAALEEVTLEVMRGETVGIIGRNGAGKTTLLRLIARVLHPTTGRVRIQGRVAVLIDLLGAFHPELTGRENVFLNAALLGLSHKETSERLLSIRSFADIGDFFDAPLRTYSAGMILRLAFSVATSVDADILVVDEALGVGDAEFQQKCMDRIEEFRMRGTTFVIVSHDVERLAAISDRMLRLERGRLVDAGNPREVADRYRNAVT
jgi:ABC-type polysaccharide/polyol phosphate transport system ATPase subunit